jgi:hypothetical protein
LISYLFGGLNQEFNPFIISYNFASKYKDFTIEDFHFELLSHEALLKSQRSIIFYNTTFFFSACKKSLPHWIVVKHIFHNLKDSIYYDLLYTSFFIALNALCDSDWAENPDNYKSTSGYWVFIR